MLRTPLILALLLSAPALARVPDANAPYEWPAPPPADQVQRAMAMKTDSGLIIVTRRCWLEVQSYGGPPTGGFIKREEFIRFLVVNEEGATRATVRINEDERATIDRVEGRTVAADGRVTQADPDKDIKKVDVKKFRSKSALTSLATVNFPAPAKGSFLELHYKTTEDYSPSAPISFVQMMTYEETPSMDSDFEIVLRGGIPGKSWSILTLGDGQGASRIEMAGNGLPRVHMGPFTPVKSEPHDPPDVHNRPLILGYVDLSNIETDGGKKNSSIRRAQTIDARGRVTEPLPEEGPARTWWVEYLKGDAKTNKRWVSKPGRAKDLDVDAAAPAGMPLEDRVRALYRLAQASVVYNPDAESVENLGDVMKRGMRYRYEGTLLFSYLLDRAGIAHWDGLVANRYRLRYSPYIRNGNLYAFDTVTLVDMPGKKPLALMPGELTLPFGCLPDVNQDSVAIYLNGEDEMRATYTATNPPEADSRTWRYDLTLDNAGDVSGKLALAETGSPARDFRAWYLYKDFRKSHPARDAKNPPTETELKKALDDSIEEEMAVPGAKLRMENFAVSSFPKDSEQPMELTATANGKGMAQQTGGTWVLFAMPPLAGSRTRTRSRPGGSRSGTARGGGS